MCSQEKEESVKANTGAQFKGQGLLLVPSEEPTLPEGVTIEKGLITIPSDRSRYVLVPIANTNKQDITLNKHTVLGHLQTFKTTCAARTEQINLGERGKQPESKPSNTVPTEMESQVNGDKDKTKTQKPTQWDPNVDFSHLNDVQRETVRQL